MSVMWLVFRNMLSGQGISVTPAGYILTSESLLYVICTVFVNPLDCILGSNNIMFFSQEIKFF